MAAPPPWNPAPELGRLLGLSTLGLMTWLISRASPTKDIPGGFAVFGGAKELASEAGIGAGKWAADTRALQAAGLIYIETGQRLGRGVGSLPNRYWLTYSEDLTTPTGPHTPTRFTRSLIVNSQNRDPQRPVDKDIHRGGKHLIIAPLEESTTNQTTHTPIGGSETGIHSKTTPPVVEFYNNNSQELDGPQTEEPTHTDIPKTAQAKPPPFVLRALKAVRWIGPPPAVDDWEILAAVCLHLADNRGRFNKPAGLLNRLIAHDSLMSFAMDENLPIVTVDDATATTMMPFDDYTQACIDSPGWEHAVTTEAARRAQLTGVPVSMALKRSVAMEVPLPRETGFASI